MTTYKKLIPKVNGILSQYSYPLTLRQIFYKLMNGKIIKNSKSSYTTLSGQLVKAREVGDVDPARMVDRSRAVYQDSWALEDPTEFKVQLAGMVAYYGNEYKRNPWLDQDIYVECILEKDTLSTMARIVATNRYYVPVSVNRGYSSYGHINRNVDRMVEFADLGKDIVVIYVGDFDPSGEDAHRDLKSRLSRYGVDADVRKVALTREQIQTQKLPTIPVKLGHRGDDGKLTKGSDPRAPAFVKKYGMNSACEIDAMEPRTLETLISSAIESCIDKDAWEESVRQTREDQPEVRRIIAAIKTVLAAEA